MPKYRKKSIVVDAFQWQPEMGEVGGVVFDWDARHVFKEYGIATLEGWMKVSTGDYVITGISGERYPCKPDIFAKTYEGAQIQQPLAAGDLENDLDFVERFIERRNLKAFDIRESAITDHFIAEAVKCWPAAIKRAIEAEDKLDRLTADLRILQDALSREARVW